VSTDRYDLIVIGSGPAGEKGALTAAFFGKRVILVERNPLLGGAVANTGTLPSKTLRETALALSGFRARDLHGVDLSLRREATVGDFMHHEAQVSAVERDRIRLYLDAQGVELAHGTASFVDAHTVHVASERGERMLHGETILIATGSAPFRPAGFAFEDDRVCDSDEILEIDRIPRRLLVVGAGVIGSEYACTFAALGADVHLIDGRGALLPFLDGEVSTALGAAMSRLGVTFHWNERVVSCALTGRDGDAVVTLSSGATCRTSSRSAT